MEGRERELSARRRVSGPLLTLQGCKWRLLPGEGQPQKLRGSRIGSRGVLKAALRNLNFIICLLI